MLDVLSLLCGGAAGAGLTALLTRSREDRTYAEGLADVLQWAFLVEGPDDAVVLNKDGALLTAWRYAGPDLETASAAEVHALVRQVNDALLPFTDGWMWHLDAVRRAAEPYPASAFPVVGPGAPDVSVPAWIDAERRATFAAAGADGQFVSEYTLSLTYLPPPEAQARAARAFVAGRAPGRAAAEVCRETLERYQKQASVVEQRLGRTLRLARLDAAGLVAHIYACVSARHQPVHPPPVGAYLNTVLATHGFAPGFVPRVGDQHVHVVAVEGYPDREGGARLDVLNGLAIPYRWSSRFIPISQRGADKLIRRHQQNWFRKRKSLGAFAREVTSDKERSGYEQQREDELFGNQDATTMLRDLNAALALNASGTVRYGFCTQVVVVADEDPAVSAAYAAEVERVLHERGFTTRVETVNAPDAFFGSLPGHGYQNLRRPLLHSENMGDLWPLTSVWPGLATNPSQYFPRGSPALMHVATEGSTPHRFNLHVGDVGHALMVGDTGKGKSTFLGLLWAQWQRYPGARTTIFDYDYSHWALAKACGARHYDLCSGRPDAVTLAPLADVDDPHERTWVLDWLEMLLELQGARVTPAQRVLLDRALVLLGEQPRAHRRLTELAMQVQDRDIRTALHPYLSGGAYGQLFDAAVEGIGDEDLQVFELKHLLALGDRVVAPAFHYLMHRDTRHLDGRPHLLISEEMHALLRAGYPGLLEKEILTRRKRNGALVLVFHVPGQIMQLGPAIQMILTGSCDTRIFLPNAEAESEVNAPAYRELGLTDREVELVARATPKRDYYVRSSLGGRVVQLALGPVAQSFIGTPPGLDPDAVRREIAAYEAQHGSAWPRAWLARAGVAVPPNACIRPAAGHAESFTPSDRKVTHVARSHAVPA